MLAAHLANRCHDASFHQPLSGDRGRLASPRYDCAGPYRRPSPKAPCGLEAGEEAGLGPRRGDDMTLPRLAAGDLRQAVIGYRDLLRVHQDAINRLNVYPVPDGDTGTNMALTLESVVAEVGDADDMTSVTKAISHGAVMRPVEGTILSVAKAAAEGAGRATPGALVDVLDGAKAAADEALAFTPEQLPVLKQAGVVD